jgi:hypothetical protein
MSQKANDFSPFAETASTRPTLSLWMLLFSLVVCAAFSLLLMMAAHVPAIANTVNDFFGIAQTVKADKPDRGTHLYFLLFCYSSPLLLTMIVGLLQIIFVRVLKLGSALENNAESDSPFA